MTASWRLSRIWRSVSSHPCVSQCGGHPTFAELGPELTVRCKPGPIIQSSLCFAPDAVAGGNHRRSQIDRACQARLRTADIAVYSMHIRDYGTMCVRTCELATTGTTFRQRKRRERRRGVLRVATAGRTTLSMRN